jgi:hypothetical protein
MTDENNNLNKTKDKDTADLSLNSSPWQSPPEGIEAPNFEKIPASTPKHRMIFQQGHWEEDVLGSSHESFLEKVEEKLTKKNFLTRSNGEDFLFFRENPKLFKPMRSILEGTFVLTANDEEKEKRLSELDTDLQDSLHSGEGGYTLSCDYVIKRNHVSYFLLVVLSLLLGTLLGQLAFYESFFLSMILIPITYAGIFLIIEKVNVKTKKIKNLKKLITSSRQMT